MREIGDLGQLRQKKGIVAVIGRVLGSATFLSAVFFMALAFLACLSGSPGPM